MKFFLRWLIAGFVLVFLAVMAAGVLFYHVQRVSVPEGVAQNRSGTGMIFALAGTVVAVAVTSLWVRHRNAKARQRALFKIEAARLSAEEPASHYADECRTCGDLH